jgi:hypothetical protein
VVARPRPNNRRLREGFSRPLVLDRLSWTLLPEPHCIERASSATEPGVGDRFVRNGRRRCDSFGHLSHIWPLGNVSRTQFVHAKPSRGIGDIHRRLRPTDTDGSHYERSSRSKSKGNRQYLERASGRWCRSMDVSDRCRRSCCQMPVAALHLHKLPTARCHRSAPLRATPWMLHLECDSGYCVPTMSLFRRGSPLQAKPHRSD